MCNLTLGEAITHAHRMADAYRRIAAIQNDFSYADCADEQELFASWLEELQEYRKNDKEKAND